MRDSEVVAAIVAGDPAGLAAAYDKYAAPLFTYCGTLLREPADAADAVHETFVIAASSLSALRDPDRLRPWLYAVARNECHRRWRSGRAQTPLEEAPDVTDESANVELDAERADLRALVNAALPGVGPAEREVLELQLRHGLDGGEVAAVLGIRRNHAHALLSRARDQLHTCLGVLLVARSGRQDCRELDALLTDWDGQLTVLLRKRVSRHIEKCETCSGRRRSELAPASLLSLIPILGLPMAAAHPPPGLREQILHGAGSGAPHAMALTRSGFPRPVHPLRPGWWHTRPVHAGAAVAGAAGLAITLTVVTTTPRHAAAPRPVSPAVASGRSMAGAAASQAAAKARPSSTRDATPASTATLPAGRTPTPGAGAGGGVASASAAANASATAIASASAAAGTLSVSPTTLDVPSQGSGTITLTASGGPVNWTVSEPPGLEKKLVVSPMSGTLAAGATGTVTVTMEGSGKPHVHLVFEPGDTTVTVVVS